MQFKIFGNNGISNGEKRFHQPYGLIPDPTESKVKRKSLKLNNVRKERLIGSLDLVIWNSGHPAMIFSSVFQRLIRHFRGRWEGWFAQHHGAQRRDEQIKHGLFR